MRFIDVGYQNYINVDKIINISIADSSPIKRIINEAKQEGRFVDLTQGRKTRAIIYTECGDKVMLSAVTILPCTVVQRINQLKEKEKK